MKIWTFRAGKLDYKVHSQTQNTFTNCHIKQNLFDLNILLVADTRLYHRQIDLNFADFFAGFLCRIELWLVSYKEFLDTEKEQYIIKTICKKYCSRSGLHLRNCG